MPPVNEKPAPSTPSPRSRLNAIRRQNTLMHAAVLLIMGPLLCWLAIKQVGTGWLFPWGLFGLLLLMGIVRCRELCLSCQRDLSMLPNERRRLIPQLSREIRLCPYCGADLACSEEKEFSRLNAGDREG
jgi:hypothetical protein